MRRTQLFLLLVVASIHDAAAQVSSHTGATGGAGSVSQGTPATTSDAAAWPVKVVFGDAQVNPSDTSDRAGRLLGQVTFSSAQPVTQSGAWTFTFSSPQHIICDSGCSGTTLGQATMANSLPVAIASNQSAVPVSGTFWQATQPVSLTTLPALTAGSAVIGHVIVDTAPTTAVTGTFWQATQPVSLSGNQAVNLAQVAGATTPTGNGTASGALRVSLASDSTGQVTLATGANTIGAISNTGFTANAGTNLNTSLLALESGGNLAALVAKDFATSAKQDTENTSLATIATNTAADQAVPGATAPAKGSLVEGVDPQGTARALATDPTGALIVFASSRGLPLQPCNAVRRTNCAPKGY